MMLGYYKAPELTEQAFTDGWLRTGDKRTFDSAGNLRRFLMLNEFASKGIGSSAYRMELDRSLRGHLGSHGQRCG
jgi:acyl-CoA synthetase (AMP-forming)/AMP-acid ligase II